MNPWRTGTELNLGIVYTYNWSRLHEMVSLPCPRGVRTGSKLFLIRFWLSDWSKSRHLPSELEVTTRTHLWKMLRHQISTSSVLV